jgi:hypothetical protein
MDPTDETDRAGGDARLDAAPDAAPDPQARRRKKGGLGGVVGNALVGFDYQVFRATKPPAELVEAARPVRGLSGEGGGRIDIDVPDASPAPGDGRSPAPGRHRRRPPAV